MERSTSYSLPAGIDGIPDVELIFRSAGAFDRLTAQMRRAMAINAHERLAIGLLWDRGPLTMSDLGSGIPLSRAAVTTLVDRLEEAGYVERGGDANDRRRTVVHLTIKGEREIAPLLQPLAEQVAELRSELGEDAWKVVREYLTRIRTISSDYADGLARLPDEELRRVAITTNDTVSGGKA